MYEVTDAASAMTMYEKCLEVQQKERGRDAIEMAATYQRIGALHEDLGEFVKAHESYNKSLALHKKNAKESVEWAMTLNSLGGSLSLQGHQNEALYNYEASLAMQERLGVGDTLEKASTLSNIGSVYYSQDKFEEALKFFHRCCNIE